MKLLNHTGLLKNMYVWLSIDNLIFKNKLISIKLRPEMLKLVNEGHLGIERCKNLIKDLIFWPYTKFV